MERAQGAIVVMKTAAAPMPATCAALAASHPAYMNLAHPDQPETQSPISDLSKLAVWGDYRLYICLRQYISTMCICYLNTTSSC